MYADSTHKWNKPAAVCTPPGVLLWRAPDGATSGYIKEKAQQTRAPSIPLAALSNYQLCQWQVSEKGALLSIQLYDSTQQLVLGNLLLAFYCQFEIRSSSPPAKFQPPSDLLQGYYSERTQITNPIKPSSWNCHKSVSLMMNKSPFTSCSVLIKGARSTFNHNSLAPLPQFRNRFSPWPFYLGSKT